MATTKEYLAFILDQLSDLEEITACAMMGEYLIYYRGKLAATVCDNRLLVKPLPSAAALLSNARREPPYPGAKEQLLVEEVDDKAFLKNLFEAMYEELPAPKQKKK